MSQQIDLACTTDSNYLPHCVALLRSVAANESDRPIKVHIVCAGVTAEQRAVMASLAEVWDPWIWRRIANGICTQIPRTKIKDKQR